MSKESSLELIKQMLVESETLHEETASPFKVTPKPARDQTE